MSVRLSSLTVRLESLTDERSVRFAEVTGMQRRGFLKAGHTPTLVCAFLYFGASTTVWVLFGALANAIVPDFGLDDSRRGLLVAVPLLGGALLRLVLGPLADRIGARRTGLLGLALTLVPLALGWLWTESFAQALLVGLLLRVAGASFAAALPLAGRWYPARYQGLALGLVGAGNGGTALAALLGPRLAQAWGWHAVFGLALVPTAATLVLFCRYAQDSPHQPAPAPAPLHDYAAVLRRRDTWWLALFYAVTFGGFVGLASFLNSFFKIQYQLNAVGAGDFAAGCVAVGSLLRPVGGDLADRFGGLRLLAVVFLGVGATMLSLAASPPLAAGTVLMLAGLGLLGMGNGAVFQLVPQRFRREVGAVTGVVGAAGGLGGFVLPTLLGTLRQATGSLAGGFLLFALAGFACAAASPFLARSWQETVVEQESEAAARASPLVAAPLEARAPA